MNVQRLSRDEVPAHDGPWTLGTDGIKAYANDSETQIWISDAEGLVTYMEFMPISEADAVLCKIYDRFVPEGGSRMAA